MTAILVVCTGNICRSPACELLMQHYLGDVARSRSAGTGATAGLGISEPMAELLSADGLDPSPHRARQLTPALSRRADIIVAMGASDRAAIVRSESSVIARALLFTEIVAAAEASAPLAGSTRKERVAGIPAAIIAFRPELSGLACGDVPDPFGLGPDAYREVYTMIKDGVVAIDRWVAQGT